ncbi:claudin-10-like [Etheostoma spectabile]|uniref:claudin-10-like n=1 Tax=Etheostoma spectabile TaxID=54343 RepID=UPI0013AFAC44|nr:claudin-10-like [Etheostoma spectabile]
MQIRVVQIWGFLMIVVGWIFVACTMAMEGWKISTIGGMGGSAVVKVRWYWSNLWRSCVTDSINISNCYDYPVLWSVEGHIQIVRGLLMAALSLGVLGFVLGMMGMECTFIGGKDRSKYKKICASGWCHIISGLLSTCGYAVYAHYVSFEYFSLNFDGLKYDLGTPLFLGWVGSAFHMTGGFFYVWSVCAPFCGEEETEINVQPLPDLEQNKPTSPLSTVSKITFKTKVASESEFSPKSKQSDLSGTSSSLERTSKSGRTAKSRQSSQTGQTTRSAMWRSGSEAGSESLTGPTMSGSSSIKTKRFFKKSYI